ECIYFFFFFSSRRRHTRFSRDWSSDVCSSDLITRDRDRNVALFRHAPRPGDTRELAGDSEVPALQLARLLAQHDRDLARQLAGAPEPVTADRRNRIRQLLAAEPVDRACTPIVRCEDYGALPLLR